MIGKRPQAKPCEAINGIVARARKRSRISAKAPAIDTGLVAAGQAVEHYEMARYGALIAWAGQLNMPKAAALLNESLQEEMKAESCCRKSGRARPTGWPPLRWRRKRPRIKAGRGRGRHGSRLLRIDRSFTIKSFAFLKLRPSPFKIGSGARRGGNSLLKQSQPVPFFTIHPPRPNDRAVGTDSEEMAVEGEVEMTCEKETHCRDRLVRVHFHTSCSR